MTSPKENPMTNEQMASVYVSMISSNIKSAEARIAKFAESVIKEPLHTLEWSLGDFEAAATLQVARECLAMVTNGRTLVEVAAHCTQEALRAAASPRQSSSPTANLTATMRMSIYAQMAKTTAEFASA